VLVGYFFTIGLRTILSYNARIKGLLFNAKN